MKKLLILTFLAPIAVALHGQRQEVTKVIDDVDNLIISTTPTTTTIIAESEESDNNLVYQIAVKDAGFGNMDFILDYPMASLRGKNPKSICELTCLKDLYWGWNFNYNNTDNVKNCFEVGVGEVFGLNISPFRNGPSFNVGVGFGMRRYLAADGYRYDVTENNILVIPFHNGNVIKSRLDSWTFHVPVMISQKIYKKLAISVGAWLNFNTYARGETQYYIGDVKFKEEYKGLSQRFFTVDAVAVIGIKDGIGVYTRWSPMSLFTDGRGPNLQSASLGVMLNF